MRLRALVVFVALSVSTAALAQERIVPGPAAGEGVTLTMALGALRAGHPSLESARAQVRAAEGDAVDAALWTNPVVDGSWTPGVRNNTYDAVGYFAFGVTQFLELAGAPAARGAVARRVVDAAEADVAALLLGLSLDVEDALVRLRASEARVEVLTRTLAGMEEIERIVRARVAAGSAPDYDAMRISVAVALARADVASASADVRRVRGEFEGAIGPLGVELRGPITYDLSAAVPLPSVESLVARANESRPDVVAATHRAEAAELAVRATRREVFPGVSLRLGAGFGQSPGQWDLGVGVAVPLPSFDRGQGSIRAAEARSLAARASVEAIRFAAERRLRGIHAEVVRRNEAVLTYRATMALAEGRILDEARIGYEAGRFSIAELADAHVALRDARLRELELATAARLAEVELARALGSSILPR